MSVFTLYQITQDYLPVGREHNRPGTPLSAQGDVIHSTDDAGATDENEDSYFRNAYRSASAHTIIDWDSITELIPENEEAWHAGPTANSMYLGTELCQPATHDPAKFSEVWKRGVWYTALKFFRHSWTTGPDLWSHAGISQRYPNETDHQDPVSYFAEYGKTFRDFVSDVDAMIVQMKTEQMGGEIMEVCVVYFTAADQSNALIEANENGGCGMFCRNGGPSVHPDALRARKIINIGGPPLNVPGEVYLSGKTAKDTLKAVAASL